MSAGFTKGPWELRYTDSYEYKIYAGSVASGDFVRIATASDLFDDNGEANARLIAVAPDLLEALQNIVTADYASVRAKGVEVFDLPCLKLAIDAIAKASPPTREEGGRDDG